MKLIPSIRCRLFFASLFIATGLHAQFPVLNEIVSNNETGIQDADGDHPDWIEIHNPTDQSINLAGYLLADDATLDNPWVFPEITLHPHSFLIVFASGKDHSDPNELHTHFKISSDGEWVYLHDPDNAPVDQVGVPFLNQDQAYGRQPDGEGPWSLLDMPTPGGSNNASNHLKFSHESGFYHEGFDLEVYSLNGDTVRFTTNGSLPSPNSQPLVGALHINNRTPEPNDLSLIPTTPEEMQLPYWPDWEPPEGNVAKATVLRATSFRNGVRTGRVYTLTFFVGPEVNGYTMPVVSLVTDRSNFFDPDTGIYVPGVLFNVNDPNLPELTGNYFQRGDAWERAVHISYFDEGGHETLSQDAGIRIHGNTSRQAPQKSLRLYARKEYGSQHFNFPLLPNRPVWQYKRFLLRAVMGSWEGQTLFTDDLAQRAAAPLDIDLQDARPVLVFLNGEYWGIHVIKDRLDEHYLAYLEETDADSVRMIDGFTPEFGELNHFAQNHDLSLPVYYDSLAAMMDINNYIDYQIAQQFFRNIDWPGNNIRFWKPVEETGKYRWIYYDLDVAFGDPSYDMMAHCTLNDPTITYPNPPMSTRLFRALLENEGFRNRFVSRYDELLTTNFRRDNLLNVYQYIRSDYAPEVAENIARWHYPHSYQGWESDVEALKNFMIQRPCFVETHLKEHFSTTQLEFTCTDDPREESPPIVLAPNPNEGDFALHNTQSETWKNARIAVFDMRGVRIFDVGGVTLPANFQISLDIGRPAAGMYVLEIKTENQTKRVKFIVAY